MKILLIGNPSHAGIRAVAAGYDRAFAEIGLDYDYVDFPVYPAVGPWQAGATVEHALLHAQYDVVIMVQPSWMPMVIAEVIRGICAKHGAKIYAINTEDPYSFSASLIMRDLFAMVFTNELTVAWTFANQGYTYLPLAYDSLQPHAWAETRDIDVAASLTFYENRYRYVSELLKVGHGLKISLSGTFAPLALAGQWDITKFPTHPQMLRRHHELQVYTQSVCVLNPHRPETGWAARFMPCLTGRRAFRLLKNRR